MKSASQPRTPRLLVAVVLGGFMVLAVALLAGGCTTVPSGGGLRFGPGEQRLPVTSESSPGASPSPDSSVWVPGHPTHVLTDPTPTASPTAILTYAPTPRLSFVPAAFSPLDPVERTEIERPRTFDPIDRPLFSDTLWVGLYGTPGGRGLGILGRYSPTETVALAVRQALSYQILISGTGVSVTPFFHMVTTIADPFPGEDGDYVHRVSTETLDLWIDVAHRHGLVSVLDIQPGHSPLTQELSHLEPFLRRRDVHLAIDPEFLMVEEAAIPGAKIGSMSGELLNLTQSWLNDLAGAVGRRKALIVHQFDNRMFSGKDVIEDYPWVELVWDADGFGGPGAKIADYEQYATEPGFEHGGFKLFYNYDTPLMLPAQILSLEPFPVFVVYQ